jgi:hypothetical protein
MRVGTVGTIPAKPGGAASIQHDGGGLDADDDAPELLPPLEAADDEDEVEAQKMRHWENLANRLLALCQSHTEKKVPNTGRVQETFSEMHTPELIVRQVCQNAHTHKHTFYTCSHLPPLPACPPAHFCIHIVES